MALDPVINFGIVEVSIGYDAAATSIVLASGDGAKLPSTFSYNLTWYNSTDYPNPADDPNVEIVRVTNRVTDTLTVTRAQESTSATTKNTASKTYKMILSITKKMIDDITSTFQPISTLPAFSVVKSGDQAIVTSTLTKLTWQTEEYDTNADFASDKFTPTVAGKYLLIATGRLADLKDQGFFEISIYKNGSVARQLFTYAAKTDAVLSVNLAAMVEANGSTDYFEVYVQHDHGSNRNIDGNARASFFQGFKIAE